MSEMCQIQAIENATGKQERYQYCDSGSRFICREIPMLSLFSDIMKFPFASQKTRQTNRRQLILDFLFKRYPAFFWKRPSIWRAGVFIFLLFYVIIYGTKKQK